MVRRLFYKLRRPRFSFKAWAYRALFWSGTGLVALAAVGFAKAAEYAHSLFSMAMGVHPLVAFVITPAGFAGVLWLTRRFFPGSEGSGIPQCIAAMKIPEMGARRSILSLRIVAGKVLLTTLGLCAGASVGREGPTVQIGAAIMHTLGRVVRLPAQEHERALILAGGAAGIAAAFNTPLAGVVFAIEELSRSFEERTSGTVLTAVIVAGIVSMSIFGNYAYFGHSSATLTLEEAWRPVLLCGVAGGILGGLFARALLAFALGIPGRAGDWIASHPIIFAAICGFGMALLGLLSGHTIYGTGYGEARSLIEGTEQLPVAFGLMKLLATILSYISGIPGGIFAPSLAVGAGLGSNFSHFLPGIPVGAVIILGMVAYFTGVVQTPITAVVIVMEMTSNQSLMLPLMATALIAFAVSKMVNPFPIYQTLSHVFIERTIRRRKSESDPETEPKSEGDATKSPD